MPDHGETRVIAVDFLPVFVISSQRTMTGPPRNRVHSFTVIGLVVLVSSTVTKFPLGYAAFDCSAFTQRQLRARSSPSMASSKASVGKDSITEFSCSR